MGEVRYFLIPADGVWLVTLEGRVMARCASRTEATEAAMVMADLMGSMHYDADVMVQKDAGEPLELVWSYGRDKLPRKLRKTASSEPAPRPHMRLVQRGEAGAS